MRLEVWTALILVLHRGWASSDNDDPLLLRKLSTGYVRGRHVLTALNTSGYVFLGVPYAEPPIGELRFRLPEAKKPWIGVINVTEYKNSCMWNSSITHNIPEYTKMGEDCLQVNVFTNAHCLLHPKCAVMFYIHGGGFTFDSPMLFPVDFLVDNYSPVERSVVLVTVAYRLGSLGFLNLSPLLTKKTSAPKNVGMRDIIMALQWVQQEIVNFGGDPEKVTITGHSSGSSADELLALSPRTAGLFNQVLVMSGGGTTRQLFINQNANASRELAISVGCANRSTKYDDIAHFERVVACLRNTDAKHMMSMQRLLETTGPKSTFNGPAYDAPYGLWPKPVASLLKNRRPYNYMIGTVSKEMRDSASLIGADGKVDMKALKTMCEQFTRDRFENWRRPAHDCVNEYRTPERAIDLSDDLYFYFPSYESAVSVINAGGRSFIYQFEYPYIGNAFYLGPGYAPYTLEQSPHHTQELVYLTGIHLGNFTEADNRIRWIFSQLIINFIKKGDPSLDDQRFLPLNQDKANYFVIDFDENFKMPGNRNGYHAKGIYFWNHTAPKHGGKRITQFLQLNPDSSITLFASLPRSANLQSFTTTDNNDIEYNFSPEAIDAAQWNRYFWIAVVVCMILCLVLLFTCYLFLYNWSKRRAYERLV